MRIPYLRELLTARCEDVVAAISEVHRVGAVSSTDECAVLSDLEMAARRAMARFREVPIMDEFADARHVREDDKAKDKNEERNAR